MRVGAEESQGIFARTLFKNLPLKGPDAMKKGTDMRCWGIWPRPGVGMGYSELSNAFLSSVVGIPGVQSERDQAVLKVGREGFLGKAGDPGSSQFGEGLFCL